ncbi:hypothetical protein G647_06108 [Cladophialophora carrionii CBS 160.54]|uniref:Uncharacterized protein n=1 Tax=Cladophialophora carrionii CBS 160.54 TaxID=1279043 RepID=V9D7T2_9EURO|nr:uncharacterized protein G647_06108 [Cladophialophora carrionii CBS 160.54]ETI22037.1 hypothetical protein G647_06108 [Cladophialophora carrionii CBS 160.54]
MPSSTLKPCPPPPSALSTLITSSGAKCASESLAISILHNLRYQHNWTELKLHLVYVNQVYHPSRDPSLEAALVDLPGLNFHHSNSSSRTASPARSGSSSGSATPTLDGTSPSIGASTLQSLSGSIPLISGLPPQHSYIHPDLQTYLIKHTVQETELPVQREFVLPLALGEKWTLNRFCSVFDALPEREAVRVERPSSRGNTTAQYNGRARVAGPGDVYEHTDQKRVLLGMRANEGMGGDGTVVYYIMQEGEVKPRQNG